MSSLIDKQRVLKNGLVIIAGHWRREYYKAWGIYKENDYKDESTLLKLEQIEREYSEYYGKDWVIAFQVLNNKKRRTKKLREKISPVVLSNDAQLLTITFKDGVLSTTTEKTRRVYVRRFLKEQSPNFYVANIDYGAKNGREHYHAIVKGRIDYQAWRKYGTINGKVIRTSKRDIARVSEYTDKLTNHAIKETTRQPKLIYSRKK